MAATSANLWFASKRDVALLIAGFQKTKCFQASCFLIQTFCQFNITYLAMLSTNWFGDETCRVLSVIIETESVLSFLSSSIRAEYEKKRKKNWLANIKIACVP